MVDARTAAIHDLELGHRVAPEAVEDRFGHRMPANRAKNGRESRERVVDSLRKGLHGLRPLRIVEVEDFDVHAPMVFERDGKSVLTLAVPGAWPASPTRTFDPEGDEVDAIVAALLERHLAILSDEDPETAAGLARWTAQMRQRPHDRPSWGVAVLSTAEGIGKSTFAYPVISPRLDGVDGVALEVRLRHALVLGTATARTPTRATTVAIGEDGAAVVTLGGRGAGCSGRYPLPVSTEPSGACPNRSFHTRGVSSITSEARCSPTRCSTSTK